MAGDWVSAAGADDTAPGHGRRRRLEACLRRHSVEVVPIVLDIRPSYLKGFAPTMSLLSMPVGAGTVLSELVSSIPDAGVEGFRILPTFTPTPEYERFVVQGAPPGTRVVGSDVLTLLMQDNESSDLLLVVDPRYWPVDGLDLSDIGRHPGENRWAVHGVAIGSASEDAREHVHCDDNGRVRRISRYYDQVTYLKIGAIVYSLVPLACCEDVRFGSLAEFRTALSARGVLSRDVPVPSAIVDLTEAHGLLTLNEHRAVSAVARNGIAGYTLHRGGVLAGERCRLHPSARIIGPVVIQHNVTIEEGTTILGPTVLGVGSSVRRGALVAQSVLARGTTVHPNAILRQRVAGGGCSGDGLVEDGQGGEATAELEPVQSDGVRLGADASAMRTFQHRKSVYPTVKLIVDVFLAALSLIVLAPLFAVVAVAIKLETRGPVFFGHLREGKDGKVFRCLKFRTMCADAHLKQRALYATNALDGPQFKLNNDPRVTRVGVWLRATNIDELPQLINVFMGQMSLVGPRPSPFRENQICVPWRRARLSVRPGITGLWQICRDQRAEGDFHQWIAYDIMYVRHLSFWLDQKILLATVVTLGGLWNVRPHWLVKRDRDRGLPQGAGGDGRRLSDPNGTSLRPHPHATIDS